MINNILLYEYYYYIKLLLLCNCFFEYIKFYMLNKKVGFCCILSFG